MSDQLTPSILAPRILIPFILVTLIWGTTWIVIRDQLGVVPPSWSVTYRFLLGGIVMMIVALIRGESLALPRSGWVFVALLGLAQFVLNFNFVYRSEHYIASGLAAVIFALLFVPNALLGRVFLGYQMTGRFLAGSALAVLGVGLLFANEVRADTSGTGQTLLGIGLAFCGVLSASSANVMQATQLGRSLPMATTIGWAMLAGAAMDAAFAYGISGPPVVEWRLGYLAGVAYLGIIASALAFSLYFQTIRDIGPAKAAYSSVAIPVIAMLISTLVEGYRWTPLAMAGGAVAMVGMLVALSPARGGARG